MSFASKVLYTGDGSTFQFTIPFPYISFSHIKVFVNKVYQLSPLNYKQVGPGIRMMSIPEAGDAIEIQRHTSPLNILVDFEDGSTLRADDLDTAYLHNFYLQQEYADGFNTLINEAFGLIASDVGVLETETDAILNALVQEMLALEAASTLQQRVTDIDNNAEAILSLSEGLQVQINTLALGVAGSVYLDDNEPVPGVDPYPDPIFEGARWYDTNDNNKAYIYQSSAWLSIEDPRVGQAVSDISILRVDLENNYAAIIAEQFAQATNTFALAQSLSILGAQNADGSAFIIDLDTVLVDSDTGVSLANRFSSLDSSVGDNSAAITTEQTTRADADSAIATTFSLMGAENGAGTAFILDENTVKIDTDGGDTLAQRFTGLSVADGNNAAAIVVEAGVRLSQDNNLGDDITAIEAEYGVDLTVNGYVSGFRLINGGTPGDSAFVILADRFAVVDPSGDPGETQYPVFQIVNGHVRFNADVEIHGNLMVDGTINGLSLINGTIGSTQIGPDSIYSTHIGADQVTANSIASNVIVADHIFGTQLDVLAANTGTLNVDESITMSAAGHIKGGQTAFDTGTGFFLGYESSQYKFSIGNSTNFITWDGSALVVKGDIKVGSYTSATNEHLLNALTARSAASSGYHTTVKKWKIVKGGTVNIDFKAWVSSDVGGFIQGGSYLVKVDDTTQYSNANITHTTHDTYSHVLTIPWVEGDDGIIVDIRIKDAIRTGDIDTDMWVDNCVVSYGDFPVSATTQN